MNHLVSPFTGFKGFFLLIFFIPHIQAVCGKSVFTHLEQLKMIRAAVILEHLDRTHYHSTRKVWVDEYV